MIVLRCVCGHSRSHEHYRRGSDCSLCGCDRWRWRWFHPRPWRQRRRQSRAFADLVRHQEELGLYDASPAEVRDAAREARKGERPDG